MKRDKKGRFAGKDDDNRGYQFTITQRYSDKKAENSILSSFMLTLFSSTMHKCIKKLQNDWIINNGLKNRDIVAELN